MNKIYMLAISLFTTGSAAFAADRPGSASLSISSNSNLPMSISIDGRYYDSRSSSFSTSNIQPGYHDIRVYRSSNSRGVFGIFSQGQAQMMYDNTIYFKPGFETDIIFNRFGTAQVQEHSLMVYQDPYGNNGYGNNGYGNNGYGNNGYGNGNRGGNHNDNKGYNNGYGNYGHSDARDQKNSSDQRNYSDQRKNSDQRRNSDQRNNSDQQNGKGANDRSHRSDNWNNSNRDNNRWGH